MWVTNVAHSTRVSLVLLTCDTVTWILYNTMGIGNTCFAIDLRMMLYVIPTEQRVVPSSTYSTNCILLRG